MHRHHALVLTLTVLASLPASLALAGPLPVAVPLDSFINQHVDSVSQLTQQVTLDPVVRRRLARHFHTSGPAMVRYIQKNLVLKKITVARRYQVYCLAPDGHEYLINSRLPVGTPVFVMRTTGKPILKLACGNPMVAELPTIEEQKLSPPQVASLPTGGETGLKPSLAPNAPTVLTASNSSGVNITPAGPLVKISPSISGGGGRSPLAYLLGLPVLFGLANTGSNGNNSGPGTNTNNSGPGTNTNNSGPGTNTNNSGPGPSPVPEPNTNAAFAIGGIGLAILLAGSRRRSRKGSR